MRGLEVPWVGGVDRDEQWLVGVSGGVDSMALLHFLTREGFTELVVCHLDHGLRGVESEGDARFVEAVAGDLGCRFEGRRVDLRERMAVSGMSLETAGREARHEFFGEVAKRVGCGRLLLGHHADDQAETVLWNLLRGSRGLRGMEGEREMRMGGVRMWVARPFLGVRKRELEEWMRESGLKFREDGSNRVNDVVRNRLRNEVLPMLEEVAGRDVVGMLVRAGDGAREVREIVDWAVEKVKAVDPQGRLHCGVLRELPEVVRKEVMFRYLRGKGVVDLGRGVMERCGGLLSEGGVHVVNLPGGVRLRRRAGRIFLDEGD